jgi:hypothetical protein
MSSETSTKRATRELPADDTVTGFQAWHLFLIGTLIASAAAAVAVRGTRPANVVFVCLTVLAAGAAGYAAYRAIRPLAYPDTLETPEMLGGRTRAALEREKTLVLRAIKELEFDRAMGKLSDADWQDMTARLRSRAIRVIRQLDTGGAAYRELIEKELVARQGAAAPAAGGRAGTTGAQSAATLILVAVALGGLLMPAPARAQMGGAGGMTGMPDARAMSGLPRVDSSMASGTVSVRLVRGQLSNLVVGELVEFIVNGKSQAVKTDATGHAVVTGLAQGAAVHVLATVDGERLDSQDFQVSPEGGIVLMLVATDKGASEQMAKAAVSGTVTIGGQSRIITQFEEEVFQVYYLFEIVNASQTPVKTGPLVFDLPPVAENAAILEGAGGTATVKGRRVTVAGPFAPGVTRVEFAYSMPPGERASIRQALPAAMGQVAVVVEKVGAMVVASPQLTTIREGSEGGKLFVLGMGPTLAAGSVLSIDISGIPYQPKWPRYVALALGLLALATGVWGAARTGGRSAAAVAREQLEKRREQAFVELLRLSQRSRAAQSEPPDVAARRQELMADLERIYGELDTDSAGPRDDQGLAA